MFDLLLAAYLLLILPISRCWRRQYSKPDRRCAPERQRMYRENITQVLLLLLVLAGSSWLRRRTPAELGFDVPLSAAGQWGLLAAVVVLAGLGIGSLLWQKKLGGASRDEYDKLLQGHRLLPRTANELREYLVLSLVVGAGWEILYRGFLLLVLAPFTGMAGAVALSALAYGASHGYHNRKQFIGSMASAFLFTLAYALTHSLWWLMLLHIGIGVSAGLAAYGKLKTRAPAVPVTHA
ncbi:MAG: CPBP family intramembrane glutamic endopeptidase [Massilia sp.]